MHEIIIRKVSKRDLNAIYEIERLSFRRPYPNGFLKTLYTVYSNYFLLAEKNGQPVGYILATHTHNNGHIISIAVHPSERRKGIGKKLLTTLEEALNKLGVTTLRLEVRKSNIPAQHFYEELDFTFSYKIEHYYNDEDGLVYYKTI